MKSINRLSRFVLNTHNLASFTCSSHIIWYHGNMSSYGLQYGAGLDLNGNSDALLPNNPADRPGREHRRHRGNGSEMKYMFMCSKSDINTAAYLGAEVNL